MAFRVEVDDEFITIDLTGLDRLLTFRRQVRVPTSAVTGISVQRRGDLEPTIESRVYGIGTNYGWRLPNRRRVGAMLGRAVAGHQFWAVPKGDADQELLVIDLADADFARLVLDSDDQLWQAIGATTELELE